MKLIASLAITILAGITIGCTTTTDTAGNKTTSFDPAKAAQAEALAVQTANDALKVAQEAQALKTAQKAATATNP